MTAIQVGTTPVQLQGSAASGWTLQNTGPGTLYIDNNASVRANSSNYSIPPGMSVPMSPNAVLYGITNTECLVQIVTGIASNQAQNVNISGPVEVDGDVNLAPGSTVGIDGPVTVQGNVGISGTANVNVQNASIPVTGNVNANISNASIPVSGSVAITSGTVTANIPAGTAVDINAGTVDIGAINNNTSYQSFTVDAHSVGTGGWSSPTIDLSTAQSVFVLIQGGSSTPSSTPTIYGMEFAWSNRFYEGYDAYFEVGHGLMAQSPVLSSAMTLRLYRVAGSAPATGNTLTITVGVSGVTVPEKYFTLGTNITPATTSPVSALTNTPKQTIWSPQAVFAYGHNYQSVSMETGLYSVSVFNINPNASTLQLSIATTLSGSAQSFYERILPTANNTLVAVGDLVAIPPGPIALDLYGANGSDTQRFWISLTKVMN